MQTRHLKIIFIFTYKYIVKHFISSMRTIFLYMRLHFANIIKKILSLTFREEHLKHFNERVNEMSVQN